MNKPESAASLFGTMPDVQGDTDRRQMPIQQVGIRGLSYPLRWQGRDQIHHGVARWSLSVALPADRKGTHMSRFHALLQEQEEAGHVFNGRSLSHFFVSMLERLDARAGRIELSMPFFMRKQAPVSGSVSLIDYQMHQVVSGDGKDPEIETRVEVPVTSLCPCSKEIAAYGAHNQRSLVMVGVRGKVGATDPEDLVELVEAQASSQLYGMLKRTDEKFVTEQAYDNPKFVEDLVRDVALALRQLPDVAGFSVEAENFESIHNHSAFARIDQ